MVWPQDLEPPFSNRTHPIILRTQPNATKRRTSKYFKTYIYTCSTQNWKKLDSYRLRTVDQHVFADKRFCDLDLWTYDLENLTSSWPKSEKYLRKCWMKSFQWSRSARVHKLSIRLADLDLDLWPVNLANVISVTWTRFWVIIMSFIKKIRACI